MCGTSTDGSPARSTAATVPAPAWCTAAAQRSSSQPCSTRSDGEHSHAGGLHPVLAATSISHADPRPAQRRDRELRQRAWVGVEHAAEADAHRRRPGGEELDQLGRRLGIERAIQ